VYAAAIVIEVPRFEREEGTGEERREPLVELAAMEPALLAALLAGREVALDGVDLEAEDATTRALDVLRIDEMAGSWKECVGVSRPELSTMTVSVRPSLAVLSRWGTEKLRCSCGGGWPLLPFPLPTLGWERFWAC